MHIILTHYIGTIFYASFQASRFSPPTDLHHFPALGQVCRTVVGASIRSSHSMSQLVLDVIRADPVAPRQGLFARRLGSRGRSFLPCRLPSAAWPRAQRYRSLAGWWCGLREKQTCPCQSAHAVRAESRLPAGIGERCVAFFLSHNVSPFCCVKISVLPLGLAQLAWTNEDQRGAKRRAHRTNEHALIAVQRS